MAHGPSPLVRDVQSGGGAAVRERSERVLNTRISVPSHLCETHQKQAFKRKLPRYIRACNEGKWSIVLWDKKDHSKRRVVKYKCNSWRDVASCRRRDPTATREERRACKCCSCHNSSVYFARLKASFAKSPHWWLTFLETIDQEEFTREHLKTCRHCRKRLDRFCVIQAAYRALKGCWRNMMRYLKRHFKDITNYVITVEQHKKDWPHMHVAMQSQSFYAAFQDEENANLLWNKWLKEANRRCGFGYKLKLQNGRTVSTPAPVRSLEALSGYIVKAAGIASEFADATEKDQLPLLAPRHFRRIRCSVGFLVPKIKNEEVTGQLVKAVASDVSMALEVEKELAATKSAKEFIEVLQKRGKAIGLPPEIPRTPRTPWLKPHGDPVQLTFTWTSTQNTTQNTTAHPQVCS